MEKDNIKTDKIRCTYCGNNPVPHLFTKFDSFMAINIVNFGILFFSSAIGRWSASFVNKLLVFVSKPFLFIGLLKFNNDPKNILNRRGQVLWEEANKRGIKMQNFRFLNKNMDLYRARVLGKTLYFEGLPRVGEDHASLVWMDDKAILKERLERAGVSVSRGGSFSDFEVMRKKFLEINKPVIVKPRLGSRGRHTTTFIYNENDLRKAYKIAKQLYHIVAKLFCYFICLTKM